MDSILQDLRFGARKLAQSPGTTLLAVLILALGVGANTATFSMVYHLLLSPLPYEEPERLVELRGVDLETGEATGVSAADLEDVRAGATSFEAVAGLRQRQLVLDAGHGPELARGVAVTPEIFAVLRVRPALGRELAREDAAPGAPAVAMLGHGYWQRRFGGDPAVLGATVSIDRSPATVVGVLPEGLQFPTRAADVWVPVAGAAVARDERHLAAVARLAPGATVDGAHAEVSTVAARIGEAHPETNARAGLAAGSLAEARGAKARERLVLLQGAVAFVLLIACANVASLLLARASARGREVAIRAAIGAGRWRIARQFLAESLMLSAAGGAAGVLVAVWLLRLLAAAAPARALEVGDVEVDAAALAFAVAVSAATGLMFGLAPALGAARVDATEALKRGGAATAAGFGRDRLRGALLAGEVALSLVLLVGGGLLMRAYMRLEGVEPGFDPANAVAVELAPPEAIYPDGAAVEAYHRAALERVAALPGVEAAGAVDIMPLVGWNPGARFEAEGSAAAGSAGEAGRADIQPVTPGYFRAMGIPLLGGRDFADAELASGGAVAVVNERFARRAWPGDEPVGKRLRLVGDGPGEERPWLTVVGVVGDVRQFGVQFDPRPEIYVPETRRTMTLVARTAGPPEAAASAVVAAVRAVDPGLPAPAARTLEEVLADSLAVKRLQAIIFGVLGAVAALLAAMGIYGVISYSATRRSREIGIRMALGATRRDVARLVVGQCAALAAVGVAVGTLGALGVSRLLGAYLYGVSPLDPLSYAAAALLLAGVALAAAWAPVRAATRVDPVEALRAE